jgi:hydroxymethylbilane synthase
MSAPTPITLRLGTRGSLLARSQSQIVANAVEKAHPGVHVELVTVKTSGDRIADRPLHDLGGKGLFTKEIEQALLSGEVDFAVHSFKDVPVTMPLVDQADLVIAAVPAREDPRDVLVSQAAHSVVQLPPEAKVGTGSLRRRCQLLALRPDLRVEMIRGNIDTRLRKLREGQFNAIVVAAAGLNRAGLFDHASMEVIGSDVILPAPGQGALALQCRRDDASTRALLAALNDSDAAECVEPERAVVGALQGDCHSPIAALATVSGDQMTLEAAVGARDGAPPVVRARAAARRTDAAGVVREVVASLSARGAGELLHPKT